MVKEKSVITAALLAVISLILTTGCVLPGGDIEFKAVEQSGGTAGVSDTTALILTFDVDPVLLTVEDIQVTGAAGGELSGSGTTRSLAISNITVADGETVLVAVTSPAGSTIRGFPLSAVVYRASVIGTAYDGGAAKFCADYTITDTGTGVFSDWYLPSKDELNKMYANLKSNDIGGFSDVNYWSSSEETSTTTICQDFGNGIQGGTTKSNIALNISVRAVRTF